ncbi:MAG: DUF424 family protein [Nanoarchaeota archaeon]|nr:DUF424 family protein [Nanoarchaeota archaeon]
MILAKVHRNSEGQKILALCDQELLGKKFEEGNKQLDLTTDFYQGEEATEQEIKKLIKGVYIINLVGEQSLKLMKKLNLAEEKHIIRIQNIPHAQILLVRGE